MEYTNDKIDKLIAERDALVRKYDREILNEIAKEKARYKTDWKVVFFLFATVAIACAAIQLNSYLFPPTSIFSWDYYSK